MCDLLMAVNRETRDNASYEFSASHLHRKHDKTSEFLTDLRHNIYRYVYYVIPATNLAAYPIQATRTLIYITV